MRIGVDARSLLTSEARGEGRALRRLYQEINKLRPGWDYVFYGQGDTPSPYISGVPNTMHVFNDLPGYRLNTWENIWLPYRALKDKIDVLHCTSSSAPKYLLTPMVVTVHDLIPLCFNDGQSDDAVARFHRQLGYAVRQADKIITVSSHTMKDVSEVYAPSKDRLEVIYWGIDIEEQADRPSKRESDAKSVRHFGITGQYLLGFAGEAKRKNVPVMMEAFSRASAEIEDVTLVLVGASSEQLRNDLSSMAGEFGISERLVLLNYVTDEAMASLYSCARGVIYCSLYEGFGLPVLEAMAHGVAVIASCTTSIPEVSGDAGLLVNPLNVDEIANAIIRLCLEPNLAASLGEKGLERAGEFSWKAAAEKYINVFESLKD